MESSDKVVKLDSAVISIKQDDLNILEERIQKLEQESTENIATMVVMTDKVEGVINALIIASSAAAMGLEVYICFNFWGISALRKNQSSNRKLKLSQKFLQLMTPKNADSLPLSKLHMMGVGKKMMSGMMKSCNVADVQTLMECCESLGVHIAACQQSMQLMGLDKEDLIDGVEIFGLGRFINLTLRGKFSYIIS